MKNSEYYAIGYIVIKNFKWLFGGCLTYTSAPLRGAVKHPPNNSLNSDKKVNSKPSETGRSPLNRLANRPVILRSSAYFEFFSPFLSSECFFVAFCFGRCFPAPSFLLLQKPFFSPFRVGLYSLKTSKKPRKTYFNPFTLFHRRMI